MIAIIDYQMGNIYSIQHALKFLGVESIYTSKSAEIFAAKKIILPGVGSYSKAMEVLNSSGLSEIIKTAVLEERIPILGICLGMQLMARSSDEDGYSAGLGFFDEDIRKFSSTDKNIKVPHVGFNLVRKPRQTVLFSGLSEQADFYFTHSHRMIAKNEPIDCSGICLHGEEFIASFEKDNIFGVQFHPEKSQNNGLKLLKNFIEYQ